MAYQKFLLYSSMGKLILRWGDGRLLGLLEFL